MSYIKKTLTDGETIIILKRYHWFFWIHPVFWSCLFFLASIISEEANNLFFALGLIIILWCFVKYVCTENAVTNKRIVFKTGFIRTNTDELIVKKVENVQIQQSIIGRIFGYGNLEFRGTGGSPVIFKLIPDPISTKKEIENNVFKEL